MPYVRITADTFITGKNALKGDEREVSEYTAIQLVSANKAIRIEKPRGVEVKQDLSGPLTAESVKKIMPTAPAEAPVEEQAKDEEPERDASGRFKGKHKKGRE